MFPESCWYPQEVQSDTSPVESSPYLTMEEMMDRYIRQTLVVTKGRVSGKEAQQIFGNESFHAEGWMRKLCIHLKRFPEIIRAKFIGSMYLK